MKTPRVVAIGAVAVTALGAHAGGWVVITVLDLPEYLVIGRPQSIEFTIRPHGQTPAHDFTWVSRPVVTVEYENSRLFAGHPSEAEKVKGAGRYRAFITAVDTGRVVITVDLGVSALSRGGEGPRPLATRLLPVRVVAAGHAPDPLPPVERGRQLFVAKGCGTCHEMQNDPATSDRTLNAIGPALANRQFTTEWLTLKLTNPAGVGPTGVGQYIKKLVDPSSQMPNLGLSRAEIAALVRYVNRLNE